MRVFRLHPLQVGIHLGHGVDHRRMDLICLAFVDLSIPGLAQHIDQLLLRLEHGVAQAVGQVFNAQIGFLCRRSRFQVAVVQGKGPPAQKGGNTDTDHQRQEKDQKALDAVFHVSGPAVRPTGSVEYWLHRRSHPGRFAKKRPRCLPA